MPTSFFTFFLPITFFLLSYTPLHLSSTTTPNARRILHQPFFPQDSLPPSQPPSPSPPSPPAPTPPKIPFSSSTPDQSPFFPSYSSSPPPPSPVAFASFPANISSLILPQSSKPKTTSQKLLAVAISTAISALVVLGLLIFYYARRRRSSPGFTDDKTYRSDNSNRQYQVNADTRTGSNGHKLRTTSSSSEFLYLGTLVNSTRLEEGPNGNSNVGSDPRKLESPELRPLPPLNRENSRQSCGNREVEYSTNGDDDNEEEEEEFYSPRGSSGGRESSSGTGSGSRRVLTSAAAAAAAASVGFDSKSIQSSCSCSSSSSASPDRSQSLSMSPPVSLSPRPKSHESSTVLAANSPQLTPPTVDAHDERETSSDPSADASPRITLNLERNVLSSGSTSPNRHLRKSAGQSPVRSPSLSPARVLNNFAQNRLASSPSSVSTSPDRVLFSDLARFNLLSPTLSSVSASPERVLEKIPSSKVSNDLDRAAQRPSLYVASSSPERHLDKSARSSPRISNVSDQNKMSPALSVASTSPERDLEKSSLSSPRISNDSDRNKMSPLLSVASSSPERDLEKSALSSPRISNVSDRNKMSPSLLSSTSSSPKRGLDKSPVSSPRISNVSDGKNMSSTLLSSASSSPGRGLEKISFSSPRMSNFSDGNKMSPTLLSSASPSPGRGFDKSPGAAPRMTSGLNERISCVLEQHISVPPPPPPLPPPMLIPQRQWDSPVASTPTDQPISKPPALVPPSRPFVLQSTSNISPIELPKSHKSVEDVEETPKPKLKPLHWDKVRASSDREMVWDQLRSSSFKLNEEMIETLFVVNTPKPKQATPHSVSPAANQENRVLDPKKAQNIAILLRALNVTIEEVCEGLLEGNVDTLGTELLESLLKMAPTKEEERKLKEYKADSPFKLGHAEKFLKAVLDVPFAFKRVDAMLYIANFESEIEYLKRSFETLEAACEELRNSRMFLKLLEAVLKTGNRMNVGTNRGDARAFKLDTLLKLVDVKGADGKTTLLHFVVQEIIRTEGARLSGSNQNPNSTSSDDAKCRKLGLQVVSSLSSELTNVRKAAAMDSDVLSSDVVKLSRGIENISEVVRLNETLGMVENYQKFSESMNRFMKMAEEEIIRTQAQESVALSLVKEITEYFHGNSAMEEAHPFRIFMVVRDFLSVLDRVCKEVGMINERTIVSSAHRFPVPVNPMLPIPVNPTLPQAVFSGSNAGKKDYNSSDDESASP